MIKLWPFSPKPPAKPERWMDKTLEESAASVAEVLGMEVESIRDSSDEGWVICLNDRNSTSLKYKMIMMEGADRVAQFLIKEVSPPPWGLRISMHFYVGDEAVRFRRSVAWPRRES